MKLNVGCGPDWKKQYPEHDGLDIIDFGQKYVWDIEQGIPLHIPGYYDEILCKHMLEHTVRYVNAIGFMAGMLKTGGELYIIVPGPKHNGHNDFGHYSHFSRETFETMDRPWYGIPLQLTMITENERGDIHVKAHRI